MGDSSTFLMVVLTTKGEEAVLEEGASFAVRLRAPFTVTQESPR